MNIFFLDKDPKLAAQYHSDKHVVKMILESAQMLSTAHRVLTEANESDEDTSYVNNLYKATHVNHPCSLWARECTANYFWLYDLMINLDDEYRYRFDKQQSHKSVRELKIFLAKSPPAFDKYCMFGLLTPLALAMPDEFKIEVCPVESYRNYYAYGKDRSVTAFKKKRKAPEWLTEKWLEAEEL